MPFTQSPKVLTDISHRPQSKTWKCDFDTPGVWIDNSRIWGVWPINVVKNISSIRELCHKVRTPAKTFFTHGIKMIKNRLKMPNFAGASTLTIVSYYYINEEIAIDITHRSYGFPLHCTSLLNVRIFHWGAATLEGKTFLHSQKLTAPSEENVRHIKQKVFTFHGWMNFEFSRPHAALSPGWLGHRVQRLKKRKRIIQNHFLIARSW